MDMELHHKKGGGIMPRNYGNIPSGLIITNKYGKIDLGQIEHGDDIWTDLASLKAQVRNYGLNVNDFRKKSDYIMEQDLDPSFTRKVNDILDNLDNIITGIDYEGVHYTITDIMLMVLENYDRLVTDKYFSTVTHL